MKHAKARKILNRVIEHTLKIKAKKEHKPRIIWGRYPTIVQNNLFVSGKDYFALNSTELQEEQTVEMTLQRKDLRSI